MPYQCILHSLTLPEQFSYRPVTPDKRFSVERTVGDIVVQESPALVPGDNLLAWVCEGVCKKTWDDLRALYVTLPSPAYTFTGYWGDVFTVYFHVFDDPVVRGRLWDLSGAFLIASVTAYSNVAVEQ